MDNLTLFGRTYNLIGNTNSDFLIKTRGLVKILWGNKFVDLIKNGKIAVDDFKFHTAKDKNSIQGQDGFYITDDGGIYIKFGNKPPINLYGEVNGTYVSFVEPLETLPSQKQIALENIGILFLSLEDALNSNILNGLAYIIDEGKLYAIKDFQLLEFSSNSSDIFSKIIIQIALNDSYSLLVDGYYDNTKNCIILGKENSGLYLYSTQRSGYVLSLVDNLILETGDGNLILIESSLVTVRPKLICDSISSSGDSFNRGYRFYLKDGEGTLEIDNLVVRKGFLPISLTYAELLGLIDDNSLQLNNYYLITDFQNEWELSLREEVEELEEETIKEEQSRPLMVRALSESTLDPKAIFIENPEWEVLYDVSYNKTLNGIMAKGRITLLKDQYGNQCNYDFKHLKFLIGDTWHYTFEKKDGTDASLDGSAHDNIIEVNNYSIKSETYTVRDGIVVNFSGNAYNNTLKTIYYNLIVEDAFINNHGISLLNCDIQGPMSNTYFHGSFVDLIISADIYPELSRTDKFKDVYMNGPNLRIVCIPDLVDPIISGTIVMFNGNSELPTGWAICDGLNGTPDLRISFILDLDTTVKTGKIELRSLNSDESEENLLGDNSESEPTLDQNQEDTLYSLIFIMKL